MKSENSQYQIIANSSATDVEVSALKDAAIEAGISNITIEKTGGTTALGADGAPEVILILKYFGATLAGGILAAIGADVWKNIKKFVTATFKKYKERFNPEEQWFYNPIIVVDLYVNEESKVQIYFPRRDEEELKKSVESLEEIFSLYNREDVVAFKFTEGKWTKTSERFKNQEQIRDEVFKGNDPHIQNIEESATVEGLQRQIGTLLSEIESLSAQLGVPTAFGYGQNNGVDIFEKENERIERYLSEFTHREGVLLTIAGLLSLFPLFDVESLLPYFLIWTTPFLVLAITTYVCSSKRFNIVSRLDKNLESEPLDLRLVNRLLKQRYFSVMKFHKITDAALVSFFVSFIAGYYLIVFVEMPDLIISFLTTILAIILGGARYYYASKLKDPSMPDILAVGVPVPCILPPDISNKQEKKS